MKSVDELLRKSLIDWALQDYTNPIKMNTLLNMSKEDWRNHLYSTQSNVEKIKIIPVLTIERIAQPKMEIEDWLKVLLKEIYIEIKKAYYDKFDVSKWGMKVINTTGFFRFGPMNAWDEIFMHFEIGYKNGIIFWDLKNYRGKVSHKHFYKFPNIIAAVVKKQGYDFLVRKNSKRFAVMERTGENSNKLYQYFKEVKKFNEKSEDGERKRDKITVGNDAHGNMHIFYNKKKLCEIVPIYEQNDVHLIIKEKENPNLGMVIKKTEDIHHLSHLIHSKI